GYSGSIDLSTLSGVSANNLLDSGEADDLLYGGLSNAYPVAGEVNGAIAGSTGSDRFVLSADQPTDRITNFEDGQDFLLLSNGLTFEQLE
ncbi:MAG TPA: hypothetical protein DCE56_23930, partial [Cyanobacteria bacterium UBA8553]|nr:hypothetical protein [Cyanobacteria bacterium UBA8553]